MVVKQLEEHGLIKAPPQVAQASTANVVTLPAPGQQDQVQTVQTQPAQVQQPVQAPVVQNQVAQPVAPVSQPQVVQQPVAQAQVASAPATSYTTASKPVIHTSARHETDEAKARRIAARYGIHW